MASETIFGSHKFLRARCAVLLIHPSALSLCLRGFLEREKHPKISPLSPSLSPLFQRDRYSFIRFLGALRNFRSSFSLSLTNQYFLRSGLGRPLLGVQFDQVRFLILSIRSGPSSIMPIWLIDQCFRS